MSVITDLIDESSELHRRVSELEEALETERMRLAACGTAAIGYFDGCVDEYKSASLDDVLLLRAELAALKAQEPVAWVTPSGGIYREKKIAEMGFRGESSCKVTPLYAAPVVSAEQQGVADGWKLVPVEPTTEMICAAACAITTPDDLPPISAGWTMSDLAFRSRYMAALAAAHAPSTTEGQGDE